MLDNEMILSMLKHVVAGLSFLHSAEPPIIHQELRSVKILLDSSCRAHLTDFQQEVVRGSSSNTSRVLLGVFKASMWDCHPFFACHMFRVSEANGERRAAADSLTSQCAGELGFHQDAYRLSTVV